MIRTALWTALCIGPVVSIVGCAAAPEESYGSDEDVGAASSRVTGPTCDPSRAQGILNDFQKALHDSIAYAEGTRGHSKDGYDVMFSFKLFSSCQTHPNQCLKFGSSCSTAAGRYQFLTKTWNSVKAARNLDTFEPENQERGAAYLIATVRKVSVPEGRAMTAAEFSNAMSKLSYEWASLPPGRYGQPTKTHSQMWEMYSSLVGSAGSSDPGSSTGGTPAGSTLTATGDVNLRQGPSTKDAIVTVVPSGATVQTVDSSFENGFYHVDYNGTVGYSSGKYYQVTSMGSGSDPVDPGTDPEETSSPSESPESPPACFCDAQCAEYGDCCSGCTGSCYCDNLCKTYDDCCAGCG